MVNLSYDTYCCFCCILAQVVSHTPEDHRMKLQSSHSEEVELRLSQSDDIDVRGEVSQESSLVPRPFPPPVFHHLQYVKTEGEGLGERLICVTSVDVRVDVRGTSL